VSLLVDDEGTAVFAVPYEDGIELALPPVTLDGRCLRFKPDTLTWSAGMSYQVVAEPCEE
jgi:hypothetical protein